MSNTPNKFKPFVGRLFALKAYIELKHLPSVILVMDETKAKVMFLDSAGTAQWINKHYLRDTPIESRIFASADTLTNAMTLMENMRSDLEAAWTELSVDVDKTYQKQIKEMNKKVGSLVQELRDLSTRIKGVQYAPPPSSEPSELVKELIEKDKHKANGTV